MADYCDGSKTGMVASGAGGLRMAKSLEEIRSNGESRLQEKLSNMDSLAVREEITLLRSIRYRRLLREYRK